MARRDNYSFEYRETANLATMFPSGATNCTIVTGKYGNGVRVPTNGTLVMVFDSQDTWWIHCWFNMATITNEYIIRAFLGVSQGFDIRCHATSEKLAVFDQGGSHAVAYGNTVLSPSTWYHLQWGTKVHASAGWTKVYLNDIGRLSLTPEIDYSGAFNDGNAADRFKFGQGIGAAAMDFDDLVINDGTGADEYNGAQGILRHSARLMTQDGTYTQFVPSSGTDHFACIDTNPPAMTPNVASDVAGNRDSYLGDNLPTLANTIKGRKITVYAQKDVSGDRSVNLFVRGGSTNNDGSDQAVAQTPAFFSRLIAFNPLNPGENYTRTEINDGEIGIKAV